MFRVLCCKDTIKNGNIAILWKKNEKKFEPTLDIKLKLTKAELNVKNEEPKTKKIAYLYVSKLKPKQKNNNRPNHDTKINNKNHHIGGDSSHSVSCKLSRE